MAGEVRGRMVAGAAQLLAQRGLQATSFSEVLELTGAPRGSVYHHFPDGKDQLVTSALDLVGARLLEALEAQAGKPPEDVTKAFLQVWRSVLERSEFSAGCAVLAVTVATDSHELLDHAAGVFRAWRSRLTELLHEGGLAPREATRLATTLVASAEGAVVLSRADQSMEPFDLVRAQLLDQVRRMAGG
jgi:TetR/AcrR family transcriptional regulator, lmrAB and yxaGH operons repressor